MAIRDLVDLSVPLDPSTPVYPGDPAVEFAPHSTIERDGFNLAAVRLSTQSGTHVDAPFHMLAGGPTLDRLPLTRFLGPAVVVDLRGLQPRQRIAPALLAPALDRLQRAGIVLLHTGWSRHWGTPAYADHPFLDPAAGEALLEAGVRTVGIDAPSVDETPDGSHEEAFPVHLLLARSSAVICENLTNLGAIRSARPTVSLLPLPFTGTDGAPVRAVAYEERD